MGHRVMAGLVPAIHVIQRTERPKASNKAKALRLRGRVNTRLVSVAVSWMAGTSPAMTRLVLRGAIGTGADQHLRL